MSRFQPAEAFASEDAAWELLPFRFHRLNGRVLLTNMAGEHLFVTPTELDEIGDQRLPADSALVRRLRAVQIIRRRGERAPLDLLALKTRTRYRRLPASTGLHIFVVSLRCEHACRTVRCRARARTESASTCRSRLRSAASGSRSARPRRC